MQMGSSCLDRTLEAGRVQIFTSSDLHELSPCMRAFRSSVR